MQDYRQIYETVLESLKRPQTFWTPENPVQAALLATAMMGLPSPAQQRQFMTSMIGAQQAEAQQALNAQLARAQIAEKLYKDQMEIQRAQELAEQLGVQWQPGMRTQDITNLYNAQLEKQKLEQDKTYRQKWLELKRQGMAIAQQDAALRQKEWEQQQQAIKNAVDWVNNQLGTKLPYNVPTGVLNILTQSLAAARYKAKQDPNALFAEAKGILSALNKVKNPEEFVQTPTGFKAFSTLIANITQYNKATGRNYVVKREGGQFKLIDMTNVPEEAAKTESVWDVVANVLGGVGKLAKGFFRHPALVKPEDIVEAGKAGRELSGNLRQLMPPTTGQRFKQLTSEQTWIKQAYRSDEGIFKLSAQKIYPHLASPKNVMKYRMLGVNPDGTPAKPVRIGGDENIGQVLSAAARTPGNPIHEILTGAIMTTLMSRDPNLRTRLEPLLKAYVKNPSPVTFNAMVDVVKQAGVDPEFTRLLEFMNQPADDAIVRQAIQLVAHNRRYLTEFLRKFNVSKVSANQFVRLWEQWKEQ